MKLYKIKTHLSIVTDKTQFSTLFEQWVKNEPQTKYWILSYK